MSGYKLCPRCRRAAPLARPQCRRCGHDYEEQPPVPGQTLVFRRCPEPLAAVPGPQRRLWPADRSLYACVSLLIALFGLLLWRSLPHTPALAHARHLIVAQAGPRVNL